MNLTILAAETHAKSLSYHVLYREIGLLQQLVLILKLINFSSYVSSIPKSFFPFKTLVETI